VKAFSHSERNCLQMPALKTVRHRLLQFSVFRNFKVACVRNMKLISMILFRSCLWKYNLGLQVSSSAVKSGQVEVTKHPFVFQPVLHCVSV
jgi:hypothetical protein